MTDEPSNTKFVVMRHKVHRGVAEVTQRAFETMWKDKGWELAADDVREFEAELESFDASTALKDDLVEYAAANGIDSSGTADELRERIISAQEGTI